MELCVLEWDLLSELAIVNIFTKNLMNIFQILKKKYIQKYGNRYEVTSSKNKELMQILISFCRKLGIMYNIDEIFSYLSEFKQSENEQLNFFDML